MTGASGFLGSHLVQRAADEGALVAALARTDGNLARLEPHPAVIHLRCDLTDPAPTARAIAAFAPHVIYHLASHPDGKESLDQAHASVHANVLATLNVLEALRSSPIELFVYGDSCKVYGNGEVPYRSDMPLQPLSSYAVAKAAGWQMCELYSRLYGVPVASVRPTLVYGARQGWNIISYVVRRVLEGAPEICIDGGDQTRDPLFVDDAIEAFLRVGAAGPSLSGAVINIGGQNEIRVADLARTVVDVMNARTPVVPQPHRMRPTDTTRSFCDNAEVFDRLGWRSVTGLREGLEQTIPSVVASFGCLRAVS